MSFRRVLLISFALLLLGAAKASLVFIDDYLGRWDRFAQGDSSLVPTLKADLPRFVSDLSQLLREEDARAPARAVFYAVVQVASSIPVDSELGAALKPMLGPDFPTVTPDEKPPAFFASDLYFWWLENASRYEPFLLLEQWREREFARTTVIPMYEQTRSHPSKP